MNKKLFFFLNQDTKGVTAEVNFLCTYDQQTEFSLILGKKNPIGFVLTPTWYRIIIFFFSTKMRLILEVNMNNIFNNIKVLFH